MTWKSSVLAGSTAAFGKTTREAGHKCSNRPGPSPTKGPRQWLCPPSRDFAFCFLWFPWERKLWGFPFLGLQKTSLLKAWPGGSRAPPCMLWVQEQVNSWLSSRQFQLVGPKCKRAVFILRTAWLWVHFLLDHHWGTEAGRLLPTWAPGKDIPLLLHSCKVPASCPRWHTLCFAASSANHLVRRLISLVLCFPGTKGPDVSWVNTLWQWEGL